MKEITEDYVSFETAKLLKEKGFDVYGDGSFGSETKVWMEYSPAGKINDVSTSRPHPKAYPAPTLQMAMKWLSGVYGFNIEPYYTHKQSYSFKIQEIPVAYLLQVDLPDKEYPSYEEACEAAIKYCLENLI